MMAEPGMRSFPLSWVSFCALCCPGHPSHGNIGSICAHAGADSELGHAVALAQAKEGARLVLVSWGYGDRSASGFTHGNRS
jgi:hypothetical protein